MSKKPKQKPTSSFLAVKREDTQVNKKLIKGADYNTDIGFTPKYNFVHKKPPSPVKFKN